MTHDFTESLEFSHSASDMPFWREVYEHAFPDMLAMVDHRQDGEHQRAGIDRSITLATSKQILVDEKVRRRNPKTGRVYEDIALEFLSDEARKAPGWVCKPLRADYIAYAIAPLGRCYLLPVIQLQQAWAAHGVAWREQYRILRVMNKTWVTLCVAVPVPVLFGAIGKAFRVQFTPYDDGDVERPRAPVPPARNNDRGLFEIDVPFER